MEKMVKNDSWVFVLHFHKLLLLVPPFKTTDFREIMKFTIPEELVLDLVQRDG